MNVQVTCDRRRSDIKPTNDDNVEDKTSLTANNGIRTDNVSGGQPKRNIKILVTAISTTHNEHLTPQMLRVFRIFCHGLFSKLYDKINK